MVWELLRESVLAQAFITVSMILAFIALVLRGQQVPEYFQNLLLIIVGYWFGTYTQKTAQSLMERRIKDESKTRV